MKKLVIFLVIVALVSCKTKVGDKESCKSDLLKKEAFEKEIDGKKTSLYILENANGIKVYITNYGARVVSLLTPDKEGECADIVLGFDNIDSYLKDKMYLGCIVGRYANRIKDGKFTIDGQEYNLFLNDGPNTLHGGQKGFDKRVWDARQQGNTLTLSYLSPDGEEGYPGNLQIKKIYTLTDENELKMGYEAETDKATIVNLSHHSYFNLKGEGDTTILDHYLMADADYFTPVDSTLIPTGEIRPVVNTPFDFTKGKQIGQDIGMENEQLKFGLGYDHNWVLNKDSANALTFAVKLWEETTGRVMEIYTTEPAFQFYSGNFMDGSVTGKSGKPYKYRAALAIEPQHFPDSPNHPEFPSTVLRPGEKYRQLSILKFGISE
jgi:aldose 1-epimerase